MRSIHRFLRPVPLKFSRLLPLILWLLLTPMATSAQQLLPPLTQDQQAIATKYSIDPQKQYSGYLVIQAMDLVLKAAADQAKIDAKTSYDDGYKLGVLDWKPIADGYKAESDLWKSKYLADEALIPWIIGGGVAASLLSFVAGALLF